MKQHGSLSLAAPIANTPPNLTEQHVNYIGIDGHIHERVHYTTGNWVHNDLTALSGNSILPAAGSALDAYPGPSGGQHINYIGTDNHVHELCIPQGGSKWISNDLTTLAKAILPRAGTPLDGYVDNDNAQHVNYIGAYDGHVHELYIPSGGKWVNNDLNHLERPTDFFVVAIPDSNLRPDFAGTV